VSPLHIFTWALIVTYVVSMIGTVLQIGRERQPLTNGVAVGLLVVNALIVTYLVAVLNATN